MISIFEIPHLQDTIAQYLEHPNQLSNCTRVCRAWRTFFTRHLWRSIDLDSVLYSSLSRRKTCEEEEDDGDVMESLWKYHRHHVQVLFLQSTTVAKVLNIQQQQKHDRWLGSEEAFFSSLRVLHWTSFTTTKIISTARTSASEIHHPSDIDMEMDLLLLFVQLHPTLQELDLCFPTTLSSTTLKHFSDLIATHHPGLRHVKVQYAKLDEEEQQSRWRAIKELIRVCRGSGLKSLVLGVLPPKKQQQYQQQQQRGSSFVTPAMTTTPQVTPVWQYEQESSESEVESAEESDSDTEQEEISSSLLYKHSSGLVSHQALTGCLDRQLLGNSGSKSRPTTRLCELSLHLTGKGWEKRVLIPLLKQSPELESLVLSEMDPGMDNAATTMAGLALARVLETFCPNLRHLSLGRCSGGGGGGSSNHFTDLGLARILKGVSRLESLVLTSSLPFGQSSLAALLNHHSTTLETLQLMPCSRWSGRSFLDLVQHCSNLRHLKVSIDATNDPPSKDNITKNDVVQLWSLLQTPWSCRRLSRLCLHLYGSFPSSPPHPPTKPQFLNALFTHLGTLHHLQSLSLGGWMMTLSLDCGLYHLSCLKYLRVLDLEALSFVRLDRPEIDWIGTFLTGLVTIKGLTGPAEKQAVEWLRAKRAFLQFE